MLHMPLISSFRKYILSQWKIIGKGNNELDCLPRFDHLL